MRTLVTALVITVAACGGGSDKNGEPSVACNPVTQTGCGTGQKCTWVKIDAASSLGKVACVADGSVAKAGSCQFGPDGETTGFDDCAAPGVCVGGKCEEICSLSPDSCPSDEACSRYSGVFDGSFPEVGACDFLCDPVTQQRAYDGAAACGSPDPGAPTIGCYGFFDRNFACSPVPSAAQDLTHGTEALGPPGGAYLNGCAAGYAPLLRSSTNQDAPVICLALCLPSETYVGNTAGATGLPGSGYTCADRGATAPGVECHFLWTFEDAPATDRNGIGFCWQPGDYVGDWDADAYTADTGFPACVDLPNSDTDADGIPQHYEYGCAPYVP